MRIAIVTDSFKPRIGGIESFLEDYIKVLTQKQHEVIVITKAKQNSRAENISPSCFPIFKENGVSVIRLSHSYLDYRGITLNPRAIAMMSGILKAVDPDVVHEHSLYSTLALVGAYSSWKRLGRPSVLTAHS
ncbi:MAG: glycosyltransferase, partial [Acidilobaceae archaeon]